MTMTLFYAPGACSLSPHILLRELGLSFDLVKVDVATGLTETGADYRQINPKGYVPALQLDSGEILTEGAAIIQYLADSNPDARLVPQAGTVARAQLQSHLNFLASEVHKAFGPLFSADAPPVLKEAAPAAIRRRLGVFETLLADGRPYVMGDSYTIADPYLFTLAGWAGPTGIGFDSWPSLAAHQARIGGRPAVQAAQQAEGLI